MKSGTEAAVPGVPDCRDLKAVLDLTTTHFCTSAGEKCRMQKRAEENHKNTKSQVCF